jgi:hypothetical protein
MKKALRFSQLSPSQKALIRLCQDLNFGSILDVKITNGEVSLDPQTDVLVNLQLGLEAAARGESELADFELCSEVCRLLAEINALQNGTIEEIVVSSGVPRRVTLRRRVSEHRS